MEENHPNPVIKLDVSPLCQTTMPCKHNVTFYYSDGTQENKTVRAVEIGKYYDLFPEDWTKRHFAYVTEEGKEITAMYIVDWDKNSILTSDSIFSAVIQYSNDTDETISGTASYIIQKSGICSARGAHPVCHDQHVREIFVKEYIKTKYAGS